VPASTAKLGVLSPGESSGPRDFRVNKNLIDFDLESGAITVDRLCFPRLNGTASTYFFDRVYDHRTQ
jgi:hypothetical protein